MLRLFSLSTFSLFSFLSAACLSNNNSSAKEFTTISNLPKKTSPTKILIMSQPLIIGGVERALINMVNALDLQRVQPELVLIGRKQEAILEKELRKDVPIISFKEACRKHYDVAISYYQFHDPDIYINKIKAEKRIQWIHGDMVTFPPPIVLKQKCKNLDRFVCVSGRVRDSFLKFHPDLQEKAVVTPNIVDNLHIINNAEVSLAQELKQDDILNVVTVSRLHSKKGLRTALQAHKRLDSEGIHFRWYIVGEGEERKILEKLIRQYGLQNKFILLGNRKNPYPYIKKADLFVLPSESEGYSTVLIEAKILKKPIMTTDIGGAREEICSGENGLIVENSEEAIYQGLKKMVVDTALREKFAFALKDFEYDNAKILSSIYETLETQ